MTTTNESAPAGRELQKLIDELLSAVPSSIHNHAWTQDAIKALQLAHAALAPPSGEGVVPLSLAEAAVRDAYNDLTCFRQNQNIARLREAARTTPQSAPVDGKLVLVPRYPSNKMQVMGLTALDESDATPSEIGHLIGYKAIRELWTAMIAAAPTPPPASQERGGDREANCWADPCSDTWFDCPDDAEFVHGRKLGDEYELQASVRAWTERFRVVKVPDEASDDYEVVRVSPPRSAAEASINSPEIDSKLIPGAAEQAKPDENCQHRWGRTSDDNVSECFYCGIRTNSAPEDERLMKCICPPGAGCTNKCDRGQLPGYASFDDGLEARTSVVPLSEELEIEAAILTNAHKAKRLREAASIVRVAEQAKPETAIQKQYREGTFARYSNVPTEQAQAGALPPLEKLAARWSKQAQACECDATRLEGQPVANELMRDAAQYRQCAYQLRATVSRLAGGVTVDVPEIRKVAKRNLRSLIERCRDSEKELMLKCLEELS